MAESREALQPQLNVYGEYCKQWKLEVIAEKNKIFIFSRGRPLVDIHFSLNESEIEIVSEFNYLGILLNRTGNFNKAITKQAEKAKQAMYDALITYLLNANSNYLIKWLRLYFFMGRKFGDIVKILIVWKKYNYDFVNYY
jgi:hypothetical protein